MDAHKLAALLLQEPKGTKVLLTDHGAQEISWDFIYCSRVQGTTQLPVKQVRLLPNIKRKED